jgi:hypothetical protein
LESNGRTADEVKELLRQLTKAVLKRASEADL